MLDRIAAGRTDLVFDHVGAGNSPAAETQGASVVRWCAYYGDVSAIRFLMTHGVKLEALGDNLDLNGAAFHGHWRLCEFLIEHGADPNAALADTLETPLHAAVTRAGRPSTLPVVDVLLAGGADPNRATRPDAGTGALMRDARTKGETPLHRAAAFASEAVVSRLLEAGARRDAKDAAGDSPLGWASWHQRPDAILRLLCYDGFSIHPDRHSASDHGAGFGVMDASLVGTPRRK